MANLSLSRVNQKLAQARFLLQNIDDVGLTALQKNSLTEAACFHLVCAYEHYLREIAEVYGLKNSASLRNESQLIEALEAAHKHPAEAEELVALRQGANTWLAQLHTHYLSLWIQPKPVKASADGNLIGLVEVEAEPVDLAKVRLWFASFISLVQRQRETSAEF